MPDTAFDVVVIGGGPAGSMAAYAAAERGLDVLLVERDHVIGSPVRCAEGVQDSGLCEFFEPDPAWIATKITGYSLIAPNGTVVDMSTNGFTGYILERVLFDRMVAEKAAAAGAHVMTGVEAYGMSPFENGCRRISLRSAETEWTVTAKVVVAADGVESRVARWAGIKTATPIHDVETCFQYTCSGIDVDPQVFRAYFTGEFAPGGYIWVFPKNAGTANVGIGISGDHARALPPKKRLDAFIDRYYPGASAVSRTCGGISCTGGIKKVIADGLMVAGDAAHHANPINGAGIINALIAGRLAGETAVRALAAGHATEYALAPYVKALDKRFAAMNRRFYKLKDDVFNIPDDHLNAIAAEMIAAPLAKRTPLRILRTALIKKPELLLLVAKVVL
jgi:digeranylgeranylglycerophospholipid reductase